MRVALISFIGLIAISVSGCGIKPGNVDAPNKSEQDKFSLIYPSLDKDEK